MIDDDLDAELRSVLVRAMNERLAETAEDDPVAPIRARMAERRQRSRRRSSVALVAAAAAVAVLVGVSAVVFTRDDGTGDRRLDTTDVAATTPPPDPDTSEGARPAPPSGPIVTDPSGLQSVPPPPIDLRADAAVVWNGSEVVIWGGDVEASNMGLPGPSRTFADGAAYAPSTRAWRPLSESPLVGADGTAGAALDDGSVLFVSGGSAARWFPDDNSWQQVPDPPTEVGVLVSVGDAIVGPQAGVRFDADPGRWRTLAAPPVDLTRSTFAWTGTELIGVGGSGTPFTSAVAVAYDPANDSWRRLPDPPSDLHSEALGSAWDGKRLVVANYDMRSLAFDPATERWTDLPALPLREGEWGPTVASQQAASGPTTAVFGGGAVSVLTTDDRWIPLPDTGGARGQVVGEEEVLFVWAGDSESGTNSLTAVDLDVLEHSARRVRVGVGGVALPDSYDVTSTSFSRSGVAGTVTVTFESGSVSDGVATAGPGRCTVTSIYLGGGPTVADPVEEDLTTDDAPRTWVHDPASTIWQTAATTSDTFTIECTAPGVAEPVARSASFLW